MRTTSKVIPAKPVVAMAKGVKLLLILGDLLLMRMRRKTRAARILAKCQTLRLVNEANSFLERIEVTRPENDIVVIGNGLNEVLCSLCFFTASKR